MHRIWHALIVIVAMIFGTISVQAQDKVIKIGALQWEDVYSMTLVTKKFLKKEGYQAEVTKFSEWGIAFAAASKGDVDLLVSFPDYVASDYWAKNKNRLEKISAVSFGLYQALVVPTYMNIDSVEQLNSIADTVGGKIVGIEPGSGLMRDVANAVKAYDLKYEVIDGSTAAMTAQLQSSIERKEPIVTMLWTPSWMVQKFDVKYLKDPKGVFPPYQAYFWLARKGWSQENSHASEVVASVFMNIEDVTAIAGEMNGGKTIEQAVDGWWDTQTDLIDRWFRHVCEIARFKRRYWLSDCRLSFPSDLERRAVNAIEATRDIQAKERAKSIECRSVWKIFGDESLAFLDVVKRGELDREQIIEKFGAVVAVADASFDVREGETFCVMGLSGSGKSTLIRHFNRLIEPTAGEVIVRGEDVCKLNRTDLRQLRASHISMVFQQSRCCPTRPSSRMSSCLWKYARSRRSSGRKSAKPRWKPLGLKAGGNDIQPSSPAACSNVLALPVRWRPTPKFC